MITAPPTDNIHCVEILISRLFCAPSSIPGSTSSMDPVTGSMYTVSPILEDFVTHLAMRDPPDFVPGQKLYIDHYVRHARVLRFSLPVHLRGFTRDLLSNFDSLEREKTFLYPLRATEFDDRGRKRTLWLAPSAGAHNQNAPLTPSAEFIASLGYPCLRELITAHRHTVIDWLKIVRGLGVRTNPMSSEEVSALEECLGSGDWQKGITMRIDSSLWLNK